MYVSKFLAIELQRLWGFVRTGNRLYNLLLHRLRWEGFKACHPMSPGRERATVTHQPLTNRFSIAWGGDQLESQQHVGGWSTKAEGPGPHLQKIA